MEPEPPEVIAVTIDIDMEVTAVGEVDSKPAVGNPVDIASKEIDFTEAY